MLILDLNFLIEPVPAFQKMCTPSKQFWHILPKGIWSLSPKDVRNPAQQQPSWNMHPSQHQKAINMHPSQHQKAINGFQGYFCKWFNTPPHVQSGKQQWYAHMCVKVYRTYAYILLGSISAVYFICAIILAHTHIHAFIWMKKTNGNMHNAFSWPL